MSHLSVTKVALIIFLSYSFIDLNACTEFTNEKNGQNAYEILQHHMDKYMLRNSKDSENEEMVRKLKDRLNELPAEYNIPAGSEVSPECRRHYNQVSLDRFLGRLYAWQFYDSDGRLPPGVTDVNLNWLGSFEVCRGAIKHDNDDHEVFRGLYCLSYTQFIAMIGLRVGKCLPSSCSDEDAYHIFTENFGWNVSTVVCARNVPFSGGDWATLVITALFVCFVIIGTIFHAVQHIMTHNPPRSQSESFYEENITETNSSGKSSQQEHLPKHKTSNGATHSLAAELLLSFSVGRTFPKILSSKTSFGELRPMAGFIVLSVTYVILYNTSTTITYFTGNILSAFQKQRDLTSLVVANGSTCFDSLFTISGILVAYCTLRELDKHNGRFQFMKYFGWRLWRVLPMYVLALMWYATLIRHIAYGPFQMETFTRPDVASCKSNWWTNILFINNFVTGRIADQCMESTWYIANDMQFYFISPVIIILLYRKPKIGLLLLTCLLVMCLVVRGVIAYEYEIQPLIYSVPKNSAVTDHFYLRPYYRIAPYLTGLFTGYMMWKTNCKVTMKWWVALTGWLAAFTTGLTVVYGLIGYFSDLAYLPLETLAIYQSVNRWAWSLAVAWSIFACVTGNGGPIAQILGWSGFIPLVRLCFVCYLTHLHMVQTYLHSLMQPMPYTPYVVMYMYVGHIFLGFMLSLVCSSLVETPLNSIGKYVTRHFRKMDIPESTSSIASRSSDTNITVTISTLGLESCYKDNWVDLVNSSHNRTHSAASKVSNEKILNAQPKTHVDL